MKVPVKTKPAPVAPQDAPAWFLVYASDNAAAISSLQREVEALKARLIAAGIA